MRLERRFTRSLGFICFTLLLSSDLLFLYPTTAISEIFALLGLKPPTTLSQLAVCVYRANNNNNLRGLLPSSNLSSKALPLRLSLSPFLH